MSKIAEAIKRKRLAQIAKMNGEKVDEAAVDEQIAQAQREAQKACHIDKRASRKVRRDTKDRGLYFTRHADRRMSQRGVTHRQVYAIWRLGEPIPQPDDRTVFWLSRKAFDAAGKDERELLSDLVGAAIVISKPRPGYNRMCVVSVLASGEDTTFYRPPQ